MQRCKGKVIIIIFICVKTLFHGRYIAEFTVRKPERIIKEVINGYILHLI